MYTDKESSWEVVPVRSVNGSQGDAHNAPFTRCTEVLHSPVGIFVCVSDHRNPVPCQFVREDTLNRIVSVELFQAVIAYTSTILLGVCVALLLWVWWTK